MLQLQANPFYLAGFVSLRQCHFSHHFLNDILWHNGFARAIALQQHLPVGFETDDAHTGMVGLKKLFRYKSRLNTITSEFFCVFPHFYAVKARLIVDYLTIELLSAK